ncbi:GTPase HflX, partial [Chromobacterium phragmitis]|nr:GTPase HflX [Chromobacterium amazonense]
YSHCQVLEERTEDEGSWFRVRGEPEKLRGLRERLNPGSQGRVKEYWEV